MIQRTLLNRLEAKAMARVSFTVYYINSKNSFFSYHTNSIGV